MQQSLKKNIKHTSKSFISPQPQQPHSNKLVTKHETIMPEYHHEKLQP